MDVQILQTPDGGEIGCVNGDLVMSDGYESAVYLSLFGGNAEDGGGTEDDAVQWWGNRIERESSRLLRSETQKLLRSIPAIPANLIRIGEAAERDLAWMLEQKIATFVQANASMPALNTVQLEIEIEIDGQKYQLTFREQWRA